MSAAYDLNRCLELTATLKEIADQQVPDLDAARATFIEAAKLLLAAQPPLHDLSCALTRAGNAAILGPVSPLLVRNSEEKWDAAGALPPWAFVRAAEFEP